MYVNQKLLAMQISVALDISASRIERILALNHIQKRSISEAITQLNITKFHKRPFEPQLDLTPIEYDLKLSAIMLYWGEGSKTSGSVKLANSDPEIIKIFLLFLRNICCVEEKRIKMINCRSSLMVKQRFCKAKSGGSIPLSGSKNMQ